MAANDATPTRRGMEPEDIFRLRWLADAQISPDGMNVAFVVTTLDRENDEYRARIWLVPADGSAPPRPLTREGARDGEPRWSPDGRLLALTSNRAGGKPQLYVLPAGGGEAVQLTDLELGVSGPVWSPDGRRICVVGKVSLLPKPEPGSKLAPPARVITKLTYKLNAEGFTYDRRKHLFLIDVPDLACAPAAPAEPRQLTDGDWDDSAPSWSPDGARIAFVSARHEGRDYDHVQDVYAVRVDDGSVERLTDGTFDLDTPAWSPDGRAIAFLGDREPEDHPRNTQLWLRSEDGAIRCLTEGFDRNIVALGAGGPVWNPGGGALLVGAHDRGALPVYRIDLNTGAARSIPAAGRTATSLSLSRGGEALAYTASEATAPAEVFVATNTGELRVSGLNDGWLAEVRIPAPQHLAVTSPDGTEIDAWLMRPAGYTPGVAHPLLLNIHGGPFAQYGNAFFDEFGVQTGAGFGVLYCNPRGSSGRDEPFARAIIGSTGIEDTQDVLAALDRALAYCADIDATKLGVLGGSYGGYLTNWIIGHSQRFAAAVSERSISNRHSKAGTDDLNTTWTYFRSEPWRDTELLLRLSPLMYAEAITTPLLLMHSEEDLRCPIEQAEQLYTALKRLRRDVTFVRFPGENHELSRAGKPSHRLQRFQLQVEFLRARLGA